MCSECGGSGFRSEREFMPGEPCSPLVVRQELTRSLSIYRAVALRTLRDWRDADDVVQSFALKALERALQLRDPRAVRSWLWRLLNTTLIDHCRRRSRDRKRQVSFDLFEHDRVAEEEPGRDDELAKRLSTVLPRIRKDYAEVILKVDLLERPSAEVAAELGITQNNLAVRLHRARRSVRRELETSLAA